MSRRFAAALFAALVTGALMGGGALAQTPAVGNETPQQNVKSSEQYQKLVCTNPAFRAHRIEKECGPLQGSQFYDNCVASFDCNKTPSDTNWRNAPPSETVK